MSAIQNVSGTAFVVAEYRADENNEPSPLYRDPVVGLFLNEDTKQAAGRVAAGFPMVKDLVRIRTKYLDDMLEQQLHAGLRQVVILGAGLDTRAVRKPAAGVTYFEIDDAATLEFKRACYARHGLDVNVKFIPGDYVKDGMIGMLADHGFDPGLPTYVIWEGNTMYLTPGTTESILTQLQKYVKRFRVSFDYMADTVIARTTGDEGVTRLVENFAQMGAPWRSGIRDVQALAWGAGLRLIENVRTVELYQKYWVGRPISSPIFGFYSLCTLGQ